MVEMQHKSGANGGIGEMVFYHTKFALSIAFPPIKLNSLALYHLEFTLMHLISIDISNNARVLEIYDGIVDKESGGGRGVKNIEVIIFDPWAIGVVKLLSKLGNIGNRTRSGGEGDGRVICSKPNWFVALHVLI